MIIKLIVAAAALALSTLTIGCSSTELANPIPMNSNTIPNLHGAVVSLPFGTGFMLEYKGRIYRITAKHVIADYPESAWSKYKSYHIDPYLDLAIFEINNPRYNPHMTELEFANIMPNLNDIVYHCGSMDNTRKSITFGIYKGYHHTFGYEVELTAWYGSSGGPVVDRNGRLIGLLKTLTRSRNRAQIVHYKAIKRTLDKHIQKQYNDHIQNRLKNVEKTMEELEIDNTINKLTK